MQVVTVNDYLARRDSEWVGQVPRFLGLQVGLIQGGIEEPARREAYECDITYVTNSELGFGAHGSPQQRECMCAGLPVCSASLARTPM